MNEFPTEDSAKKYLEIKIWDGKPTCPFFKQNEKHRIWIDKIKKGNYMCKDCRKQFRVIKGILAKSLFLQEIFKVYGF